MLPCGAARDGQGGPDCGRPRPCTPGEGTPAAAGGGLSHRGGAAPGGRWRQRWDRILVPPHPAGRVGAAGPTGRGGRGVTSAGSARSSNWPSPLPGPSWRAWPWVTTAVAGSTGGSGPIRGCSCSACCWASSPPFACFGGRCSARSRTTQPHDRDRAERAALLRERVHKLAGCGAGRGRRDRDRAGVRARPVQRHRDDPVLLDADAGQRPGPDPGAGGGRAGAAADVVARGVRRADRVRGAAAGGRRVRAARDTAAGTSSSGPARTTTSRPSRVSSSASTLASSSPVRTRSAEARPPSNRPTAPTSTGRSPRLPRPKPMLAAHPPRLTSRSVTRNDSATRSSLSATSESANLPGKVIRWSVAMDPVTMRDTARTLLLGRRWATRR